MVTSANPPSMGNAATRSPAARPSASSRTIPATSLPGTNGSSGLIWYIPRVCSTSGKDTPAARTSILTPSPLGSSMSASFSDSGPPSSTIWIARIERRLSLVGGEAGHADARAHLREPRRQLLLALGRQLVVDVALLVGVRREVVVLGRPRRVVVLDVERLGEAQRVVARRLAGEVVLHVGVAGGRRPWCSISVTPRQLG